MDPITIATTVGGLVTTCTKVIKTASDIIGQYQEAPMAVSSIASEVSVLSAALSQIENVAVHNPDSLVSRLNAQMSFKTAFDTALNGCILVLSVLERELQNITGGKQISHMGKRDRVRAMFNQDHLQELLQQTRGQQTSLNLLLTALQTESLAEIKDMLHKNSGVLNNIVRRTGTLRLAQSKRDSSISDPNQMSQTINAVQGLSLTQSGSFPGSPATGPILDNTGPIKETTAFLAASMIHAIEQGNSDLIDRLLMRGYDVNYLAPGNRAPLIAAVQTGNTDLIAKILDCGADTEIRDNDAKTPLVWAGEKGFTGVARLLIEKGAKINAPGHESMDTLNQAAFSGQFELVQLLLEFGADIETIDDDKMTPLHNASQFGHYKTMEVLLKMGAKVDVFDKEHRTALMFAITSRNAAAVELLIRWGADASVLDNEGYYPIHWASTRDSVDALAVLLRTSEFVKIPSKNDLKVQPLHHAATDGKVNNVNLLLDKGADIDALDAKEQTPLFRAVDFGRPDVVKALLKRKANMSLRSVQGHSALTVAVLSGNVDITRELLDANANIKEKFEQFSLLSIAVRSGKTDMIAFLLGKGVAIDERSGPEHSTALQEAVMLGHLDIIQFLIRRGASVQVADINLATPLHRVAFTGNCDIMEALLARSDKSIVRAVTDTKSTALHFATKKKQVGAAKLLLKHKAKVTAKENEDVQPIHLAAQADCAELIHLFIKEGASIKAKDIADNTPLHYATGAEAVDALLQYKPNKEQWNKWGQTPLDAMAQEGHVEAASLLLRRGAKVDCVNRDKETPLHRAICQKQTKMVELLLEREASPMLLVTQRRLNSLHVAVETKEIDVEVVKAILNKAPQLLNSADRDGKTALYQAIEVENASIALYLLEQGANTECNIKEGWTPFLQALQLEQWDVVEALLARGCNVFAMIKKENLTSLHMIATTTRVDIARKLLSKGLNPEVKSSFGRTAWEYAVGKSNNPEMAEVIPRYE